MLTAGKPAILVVMHHTFNPNHVVAESRRQVTNPNVRLTVDCLFHDGKFLSCTRNHDAWHAIQRTLGVPVSQVLNRFTDLIQPHHQCGELMLQYFGKRTITGVNLWNGLHVWWFLIILSLSVTLSPLPFTQASGVNASACYSKWDCNHLLQISDSKSCWYFNIDCEVIPIQKSTAIFNLCKTRVIL